MGRKRSKGEDCACGKNCKMVSISHVLHLIMKKRGVMVRTKESNHRQPRRRYTVRSCQVTLLKVEDAFREPRMFGGHVTVSVDGQKISPQTWTEIAPDLVMEEP